LSNSSSGGTDCYFSPLPVYWKKSMLEGGSSILFLFLTITPQPNVVNKKEKKHKRSQISCLSIDSWFLSENQTCGCQIAVLVVLTATFHLYRCTGKKVCWRGGLGYFFYS
jgi:hypothetical protein